jgi:hypothetical protein
LIAKPDGISTTVSREILMRLLAVRMIWSTAGVPSSAW